MGETKPLFVRTKAKKDGLWFWIIVLSGVTLHTNHFNA